MLNLLSKTISKDDSSFSLKGMINPCFQNIGDSPVIILGNTLNYGDAFEVNTNGMPLSNEIAVIFTDQNLH